MYLTALIEATDSMLCGNGTSRFINLVTNGSHGKSIVVGVNVILKRLANVILSSEQLEKLMRNRMEGWQDFHYNSRGADYVTLKDC